MVIIACGSPTTCFLHLTGGHHLTSEATLPAEGSALEKDSGELFAAYTPSRCSINIWAGGHYVDKMAV